MCAKLPVCDPTKIKAPTIIMRGEYDGIAGFGDLMKFFEKLPNPPLWISPATPTVAQPPPWT